MPPVSSDSAVHASSWVRHSQHRTGFQHRPMATAPQIACTSTNHETPFNGNGSRPGGGGQGSVRRNAGPAFIFLPARPAFGHSPDSSGIRRYHRSGYHTCQRETYQPEHAQRRYVSTHIRRIGTLVRPRAFAFTRLFLVCPELDKAFQRPSPLVLRFHGDRAACATSGIIPFPGATYCWTWLIS